MLLFKVHKGHLTRSYVHMAIQNISVPYIILPFRILYYFRSVPFREIYPTEKYLFKDFKLKLPAFARTRPLLFNRTGLSNLLNKIQFTFEVVPCLI